MSAHTQGPWVQCDQFGPTSHGTCAKAISDNYLVASCTGYYGREQGQANARLIAAAPELLEALIRLEAELVEDKYGECYEPSPFENLALARAAIAKATGGAQ